MPTAELINENVLKRFVVLNQRGRLAHAYLFLGPKDVGKFETAIALAKLVNCDQNQSGQSEVFCDQCPSCIKVNAMNHPDIHVMESVEDESIKIETVRLLIDQIQLKPLLGLKKIFIIKDMDRMTIEAGNALLKTLEEPSINSLLILTSANPDNILDTIRSRCHSIYFEGQSKERLALILKDDYHVPSLDAAILAAFSRGTLGKALKLKDENIILFKNEVIDQFICSAVSDSYVKEILAEEKSTRMFLDVLSSWVRDAIVLKTNGGNEFIIHQDRMGDLNRFEARYTFDQLTGLYEDIVHMYKLMEDKLNLKIPLMIIKESLAL